MTRYYILTADKDEDEDWEGNRGLAKKLVGQDNLLDIQLGFDEEFVGYWLTIQDYYQPAQELEDYLFHNIKDVPDVRMTLTEIEQKLAEYNVGIPYQLAVQLVIDGIQRGYLAYVQSQRQYKKTKEFKDFYQRSVDSSPQAWQPSGKLPAAWGTGAKATELENLENRGTIEQEFLALASQKIRQWRSLC